MDDTAKEENPNLVQFLEERLPAIGLDEETYGPYVLGTSEPDELEEIIQLLQASSESHGEDEAVWEELSKDILHNMKLDDDFRTQKAVDLRELHKTQLEDQLAEEKRKQEEEMKNPPKEEPKKPNTVVDDAAKKALLNRFAYDEGDDAPAEGEGGPVTNRDVATQVNAERSKELRAQKGVKTKKEEQQKTKDQRASKQQDKEDRRKRTTKGERKA
jgi:hypothetical protein